MDILKNIFISQPGKLLKNIILPESHANHLDGVVSFRSKLIAKECILTSDDSLHTFDTQFSNIVLGGFEYLVLLDDRSSVYSSIRTGPLDDARLSIIHRFFHRDNLLLLTFTYPCLTTSIVVVSMLHTPRMDKYGEYNSIQDTICTMADGLVR